MSSAVWEMQNVAHTWQAQVAARHRDQILSIGKYLYSACLTSPTIEVARSISAAIALLRRGQSYYLYFRLKIQHDRVLRHFVALPKTGLHLAPLYARLFFDRMFYRLVTASSMDSVPHGGFIKSLQTSPLWKDPFRNPNVFLYLTVSFGEESA